MKTFCVLYFCRYRGQLEQDMNDMNFPVVRGIKFWNTLAARLAFVIVFEVS